MPKQKLPADPATIWKIGHSTRSIEEFLDLHGFSRGWVGRFGIDGVFWDIAGRSEPRGFAIRMSR